MCTLIRMSLARQRGPRGMSRFFALTMEGTTAPNGDRHLPRPRGNSIAAAGGWLMNGLRQQLPLLERLQLKPVQARHDLPYLPCIRHTFSPYGSRRGASIARIQ